MALIDRTKTHVYNVPAFTPTVPAEDELEEEDPLASLHKRIELTDEKGEKLQPSWIPPRVESLDETGLNQSFLTDLLLKTLYFLGTATGYECAAVMRLPFQGVISILLENLRREQACEVLGQKGIGDGGYQYALGEKGRIRCAEALEKSHYFGPAPLPLNTYIEAIKAQSIHKVTVTYRNIREAFSDLILSEEILDDVGPAVNSGSSIFLFGYPGNGKTAIAERVTRVMGDNIFIPFALEADGWVIKVYDPINHEPVDDPEKNPADKLDYDGRWVRCQRPVVMVGGELIMQSLDLVYDRNTKYYEAPFQLKASNGMFLIDDFGRQMIRPQDLLNRWIVPLEKGVDFLTLVTGKKLEIPFDELIVFSTNLDPSQLADEAFLRRIKFKINVIGPTEEQFKEIFKLVARGKKIPFSEEGFEYLVENYYRKTSRPFRSCQPRDILNQLISIAKYRELPMEMDPDLLDKACGTYFVQFTQTSLGVGGRTM